MHNRRLFHTLHESTVTQIERLTLEAEHVQDPSVAPRDHSNPNAAAPAWRGLPVQMQLPPNTGPVKVSLAPHASIICSVALIFMLPHLTHRIAQSLLNSAHI